MSRIAVALAVLALAGCEVNLNSDGIVSRETRRFPVSGTPTVDLATFDGAIEIHSWDRDEVEVEIEKRAVEQRLVDEMKVTAEQQGDRIVLKVEAPNGVDDFEGIQVGVDVDPSARLRVALPRSSDLVVMSGDGSISVEDVSGTMRLTTRDGSVQGSRLEGDLVVRTGDGSIRLDNAAGTLDLETEDGSITVEARASGLRARTADGTIRLEILPDAVMSADWDVQTGDGSVVVSLPSEFDAVVDAETRDGRVRATHPALGDESRPSGDSEERRRALQATLGSGGHTLRIRSADGSIRIE